MNTAFSDSMFSSGSSYIVVIHGEEPTTQNSARGTDLILPPHVKDDPIDAGDTFTYTEDGVTYRMRYITLTSSDTDLYVEEDYALSNIDYSEELLSIIAESAISIGVDRVESVPYLSTLITIASLIGDLCDVVFSDPLTPLDPDTLIIDSATAWTRSYIQVYNSDNGLWYTAQCSSYAVSKICFIPDLYYCNETNEPELLGGIFQEATIYSPFYNNLAERKSRAVMGFNAGTKSHDRTGDIYFHFVVPQEGSLLENLVYDAEFMFSHEESHYYLVALIQED